MKSIALLLAFALCAGCTSPRYVYTPSAVNNPFLAAKGDGEINAMYSTSTSDGSSGSSINGLDLMGSYALSNNFGVQAHYFYRGEKETYSNSWSNATIDGHIQYKRNEFELGLGGFFPLDKSKSIIFAAWAGAGFGGTNMNESRVPTGGGTGFKTGNFDYKSTRLYFQPSFNFIVSEHFKAGIVGKFNSISFSNISTNFDGYELLDRSLDNLKDNHLSVIEAGYNISFGFKGFNHVLFTHQLTFAGTKQNYDIRPLNFSFGLSYSFFKKAEKDHSTLK